MITKTTNADKMSEEIDHDRRLFLAAAAMTIAAAQLGAITSAAAQSSKATPATVPRSSRGRTRRLPH